MTLSAPFKTTFQNLGFMVIGLALFYCNVSASSPPCLELLKKPKTSERLKQMGLPVPQTLFEIERMKEFIGAHPRFSGSLLPLATRAYSDLQVKYKINKLNGGVDVLVHKTFRPNAASEFDGNWEAFQNLSKLKRQNLLGDFQIVSIKGRSIQTMTFYLDYVEGVEIYPLVMEPNPRGAGFRPVQVFSQQVKDLLSRFNQSIRQVAQLWTQKNESTGEYEIEVYFDDIQGEEVMTYLLVHSIETGERVFEISMFNTIYEPHLDAFVIFDPY